MELIVQKKCSFLGEVGITFERYNMSFVNLKLIIVIFIIIIIITNCNEQNHKTINNTIWINSDIKWEVYNLSEEQCCAEECTEGCCSGGCLKIIKNESSRLVENSHYCIVLQQYKWVRMFFVTTNKYTPEEIMKQIFCEGE